MRSSKKRRAALDEVEDGGPEGLLSTEEGGENDPFAEVNAQASELGLTACSD